MIKASNIPTPNTVKYPHLPLLPCTMNLPISTNFKSTYVRTSITNTHTHGLAHTHTCMIDNTTSCRLCYLWMGQWRRKQRWKLINWLKLYKKMGQVKISNMRVCMGLYIHEPGVVLQLTCTGATEWQSPAIKIYVGR